jgi:hypothetical protein
LHSPTRRWRIGLRDGEVQTEGIAGCRWEVLRTEAIDETQDFKILIGADDRILALTMIGSEAGEVMAGADRDVGWAPVPATARRGSAHLRIAEGLLANVPPRQAQSEGRSS